jgi:hypothetical protein
MLKRIPLIIVWGVSSCLLLAGLVASIESPSRSVNYFKVNVDHLNLRDSPNGKEISILLRNTQVKEMGREGNWVNVEVTGWVWSPYLTFDKTVAITELKPEKEIVYVEKTPSPKETVVVKTTPSQKETVYVVKEVIKTPGPIESEKEMKYLEKEMRMPHEMYPMMRMPGATPQVTKEVVWPPEDILRDIGYSRGFREGWREGKGEGYLMGKKDGHSKGYNKGKRIGKFLGFLHGSSCTLILGGIVAAIYYYYYEED